MLTLLPSVLLDAQKLARSCVKIILSLVTINSIPDLQFLIGGGDYNTNWFNIQDDLETEKFVVFACATYGEGDPPDNAKEFHEWLMNEERPSDLLKNTRFAVSNATFFFLIRSTCSRGDNPQKIILNSADLEYLHPWLYSSYVF